MQYLSLTTQWLNHKKKINIILKHIKFSCLEPKTNKMVLLNNLLIISNHFK